MKADKIIGWLLIIGAVGVLVPYTLLTMHFQYPDILRKDTSYILEQFHQGGSKLIFTWWAFAMLGLPLLIAYLKMGQRLEGRLGFVKTATTLGVIAGIAQIIGLLRWVFVVPVLANNYVQATDIATKEAAKAAFQTIHQFGGVLLGEHIGQLFTIAWTILMSLAFIKLRLFPKWVNWSGIIASLIYLLAQAELFATVIPGFMVWEPAGFVGSTLWLVWLIVVGVCFMRVKKS